MDQRDSNFYDNDEINDWNNKTYLTRINQQYSSMSKRQKLIANYFLENRIDIKNYSITTLARKIGTDPSALSRFAQFLHYKGFADMRFCYEKDIVLLMNNDITLPSVSDGMNEVKGKLLNLYTKFLTDTLVNLSNNKINLAAKKILSAHRVYIYSDGTSGSSAQYMYQLFTQIGISCNSFSDSQLALMSTSHLKEGDVAIGINYSGGSQLVANILNLSKSNHATTVVLTSRENSRVGRLADILLSYSYLIPDDLKYVHIARMCELSIIGQLQFIFSISDSPTVEKNLVQSNAVVKSSRNKMK